jgi:hypothetical protein
LLGLLFFLSAKENHTSRSRLVLFIFIIELALALFFPKSWQISHTKNWQRYTQMMQNASNIT